MKVLRARCFRLAAVVVTLAALVGCQAAKNASNTTSTGGGGTTPGQLAVSPTSLSFGNVVVGGRQNQTGTLSATGAAVTVSSIGTTDPEFTVSGITLPATIAAGTTANFTTTFTPSASGAVSATLNFVSNASNTPTSLSVSGSGTAAAQHTVTLNWNASTSANVIGYNIYRGSQSGGPYTRLNTALDASTSDIDSTVAAGQTYYYVVTAVDSNNLESGYSNQVLAAIPTP